VINFVNVSFALFTPPLGDFHTAAAVRGWLPGVTAGREREEERVGRERENRGREGVAQGGGGWLFQGVRARLVLGFGVMGP
jgi:hypothetical protein